MNTHSEKQRLREYYSNARKQIPPADAATFSLRIARAIFSLPKLLDAGLILIYHKIGAEADVSALVEMITGAGRRVALPYCDNDGLLRVGRIENLNRDLVKGAYGIMEPADSLKGNAGLEEIGAAVCPGIAFDKRGGRLGRGGGHYDRLLRNLAGGALVVGAAFDCQICPDSLPREEHDVPMNVVVTETRTYHV